MNGIRQSADTPPPTHNLGERLERGAIVYFPACPFSLVAGDDRRFLLRRKLSGTLHKNISYDPAAQRTSGCRTSAPQKAARLRRILADFSDQATRWLIQALPGYAACWRLDRAHYRPEEEALRSLRHTARNELLHLDTFPTRPSHGDRILRLFVNLNDQEPQTWVTSESFACLLQRFGREVGLPHMIEAKWSRRLRQSLLGIFQSHHRSRTVYDCFMLRFHHFLKSHEKFQEKSPKRFWTFAPGSAWLLFSDGISHGTLRGQYALDHSYFISPQSLECPEESPAAILERACGMSVLRNAA